MMKKLLVLTLVLAMATLANAGLSFNVGGVVVPDGMSGVIEIPVSTIFEVQIVNDEPVSGPIDIGFIGFGPQSAAEAGAPIAYPNLGTWTIESAGIDPADGQFYYNVTNTVPAVGTTPVGPLFGILLHCTAEGPVPINVWNSNFDTVLAHLMIIQTPEPMTLALLGLGGLFLRRK
jgi:hypothetical protein